MILDESKSVNLFVMNFTNIVKTPNSMETISVKIFVFAFKWFIEFWLGTLYKSGTQFCEANNFNVVTADCFAFDETPFSIGIYSTKSSLVIICLVIFIPFLY